MSKTQKELEFAAMALLATAREVGEGPASAYYLAMQERGFSYEEFLFVVGILEAGGFITHRVHVIKAVKP